MPTHRACPYTCKSPVSPATPSAIAARKNSTSKCNYYGAMPTYPACKSPSEKFYIYECNCREKANIYECNYHGAMPTYPA